MKVLNTFFKVAAFSFVTVALAAMPIKMKAQTDAAIRILNPNPVSYALGAVDSVVVQINNVGQDTIYNLGIVWGINGVFQNHVYFSTMPGLASGDSICIVIGMITYPIYPVIDICAFIAGVHGLPDINPNNDTSCVSMVVDFEIEAIANSSVGNCLPAGMPVIQTVLVTNKGNIDVHNIPLMLVVSDNNGAVLDVQYGTLNVLLAGTAALVTFPMPYIVPFSQNYTVIAGIGDKSQFYFSDTLTECADTAAMTSEISGKIFRQDSTPVTSGEVRLYYPYFAWQYYSVASVPVANDGSYSFTTVYTGNYLIKFVPDSSENALPTYYGNTEFWYLADTVTVSDTLPIQNIDIFIIPQSSLSNGSSFISGYVGQKDGQKSLSQKS
ncbi:MAG: hypothetical protein FWH36_08800, partial [Lentimicrobiaceae bacterium]|nr:hypothetical protein [Lentimicrobiaceae bacterium]